MKLVGMMPVRNEAHELGLSLRVALMWCDEVVVLIHACSDQSAEMAVDIAREFNPRVTVIAEDKESWDEMRHRQIMLDMARSMGATHLAVVDADEILTGNLLGSIRNIIKSAPRAIIQLPGYNLRGSLDCYHVNGVWGQRWFSIAFADDPNLHWTGDTFHHREPFGLPLPFYQPISQGRGGIMHLWGCSERRLKAKHRLYRLQERLRWPTKPVHEIEQMYSMAENGRPWLGEHSRDWAFSSVPAEWWEPYKLLIKHLDLDAVPWQEAECERIIANTGADYFHGLSVA